MNIYEKFGEKELAILEARARRVEKAAGSDQDLDTLTMLTVHIHDEVYGLPVAMILGVYEDVPITLLPGTPEHIAGIANLRGHLFTTLDVAAVLEVPGRSTNGHNALVVATGESFQVALLVDRVSEVQAIPRKNINPVSIIQDRRRVEYLSGVLADGTALLDVKAMVEDPALVVDHGSQS